MLKIQVKKNLQLKDESVILGGAGSLTVFSMNNGIRKTQTSLDSLEFTSHEYFEKYTTMPPHSYSSSTSSPWINNRIVESL